MTDQDAPDSPAVRLPDAASPTRQGALDPRVARTYRRVMPSSYVLTPVGHARSTRAVVEDDRWDAETCSIELDARFGKDALSGLETFSHVEVVFVMDRVPDEAIVSGARHPRNNPSWPAVGIFAQRAKNRPNRLGTTVCRVHGVEGRVLRLSGLDAVDGTPIVDIKPWVRELGPRGEVVQPAWMSELMAGYWA